MALNMKDQMTLKRDPLIAHSHLHFSAVSRRNALLIFRHLNTSEDQKRTARAHEPLLLCSTSWRNGWWI